MRLAVLADIHGNADALEAVRADLARQSPDLVVNLGDCLSGPLEVERTADLLMEAGWPAVRGNHDRWLVEPEGGTVWEVDARPRLSAAHRDWLAALPATRVEAGTPAACYAILDRTGEDWRVTFRQIPYDHDRAARLARRYDRPDWSAVLATGWLPAQKGQGAL
ncbi:metallophosphoesterase family protein [Cereibacter johrii]|uniref:metallophosphoesterase family protein n=1 Tax=Cereibacter johrii TaxID=445629 RepID=UPI003CF06E3A